MSLILLSNHDSLNIYLSMLTSGRVLCFT